MNGKQIFFSRNEDSIDGIPFILCSYYWTGRSGSLRYIVYTEKQYFQKYEKDMYEMLNGLAINRE